MYCDYEQQIYDFSKRIKGAIPYYGFSLLTTEFLFLKYICTCEEKNFSGNPELFQDFCNMFAQGAFDKELTEKVFDELEKTYGVSKGLLSVALEDISECNDDEIHTIFNSLSAFTISEDPIDRQILLEKIINFGESRDVSKNGLLSTNSSLAGIVSEILDVKQNESYMDSFTGFGKSFLHVDAAKYMGFDIYTKAASVANMLMIMAGKKNFKILNEDFYTTGYQFTADKIFSDGPVGGKLSELELSDITEASDITENGNQSDYYTFVNTLRCLKPGGRAVVTCVNGLLFKKNFESLRRNLTANNLRAVIALPALWNGTKVPTNLVVLDDCKTDDKVAMIDVSSGEFATKNSKGVVSLSDLGVNRIVRVLEDGEEFDNVASIISADQILNQNENTSWVPSHYIKKKEKPQFRPSEEIKKEICEMENTMGQFWDNQKNYTYRYLILENLTWEQYDELSDKNNIFSACAADPSQEKICLIYITEDNRFFADDQYFYYSIKRICKQDKYKEFDAEKGGIDEFIACWKQAMQCEI